MYTIFFSFPADTTVRFAVRYMHKKNRCLRTYRIPNFLRNVTARHGAHAHPKASYISLFHVGNPTSCILLWQQLRMYTGVYTYNNPTPSNLINSRWPGKLPGGRSYPAASTAVAAPPPDVSSIGPPSRSSSASDVPRASTPKQPQELGPQAQALYADDTQLPQQPRYPRAVRQHQHGQHQYQHQHRPQYQQFENQSPLFGLDPSFPAVQPPPLGARPVKSEETQRAGSGGGGGGGGSGGGGVFGARVGGPHFSAPEGLGSGDSNGGRSMLPMEEVRVEPSRKVSGSVLCRSQILSVCYSLAVGCWCEQNSGGCSMPPWNSSFVGRASVGGGALQNPFAGCRKSQHSGAQTN